MMLIHKKNLEDIKQDHQTMKYMLNYIYFEVKVWVTLCHYLKYDTEASNSGRYKRKSLGYDI